jgi:transmembrane sensor
MDTTAYAYYEELLDRYLTGSATQEEAARLFTFIDGGSGEAEQLLASAGGAEYIRKVRAMGSLDWTVGKRIQDRLLGTIRAAGPAPFLHAHRGGRIGRWAVAAAVLLLLGAGTYLWVGGRKRVPEMGARPLKNFDVLPGTTKAVLTLSGGKRLVLDSAGQDTVLREGDAIIASADGKLAYNAGSGSRAEKGPVALNTLTTPRGGQYQLTLPDGSRVWLNAASAITYPVRFTGNERKVMVSGEVYFEVAQNARQPFKLDIEQGNDRKLEIDVLGTSFNVNAYADENDIKATLLDGSIRVGAVSSKNNPGTVLLRPGQQARITDDRLTIVDDADLDKAIAWKEGAFNFNDEPFEEVMRQIARWYNITIAYEGPAPDKVFYGEMGRNLNLSECLNVLTKMKVRFRLEENRLVILP